MKVCAEDGCDRRYHARGYCQRHYLWLRRHGQLPARPTVVAKPAGDICLICHTRLIDHPITQACYLKVQYA